MSQTTELQSIPRSWADGAYVGANSIGPGAVTAAKLSTNAAARLPFAAQGTISTTTGGEVLLPCSCAGTITSIAFVAKDALAKSDTNFISFGVLNKFQTKTIVDNTVAANTTKSTGGQALAAYGVAMLTLTANVGVNAGDILALSATVTGTLANQVTEGIWVVAIAPS